MNNLFQYTKIEGQGWLVEKPEMPTPATEDTDWYFNEYREHIKSLRRFKYDYPDPGKEMELGKDFETIPDEKVLGLIAIPITQRTYSEQDLFDTWNGGYDRAWDVSKGDLTDGGSKNQQEFFKTRFGIEIK